MASKLIESLLAILISIDILLCTVWQATLYPFGLASKPSGRRMISSFVGEASANQHRWGRILELIIDLIFCSLEEQPAHCRRAYEKYKHIDD